jgi:hypothetical protein
VSTIDPSQSSSNPRDVPSDDGPLNVTDENKARASRALHDAFARLAPQGSDEWNFSAAFTHLGDRYGPYHPGASALNDALASRGDTGARPGRLDRLRGGRGRGGRSAGADADELSDAMGMVVEAFRFLSARVTTLEARLAAEDRPIEGAAWLAPARELGGWVEPVAAHLLAATPGGAVLHADCGDGSLLRALEAGGAEAHGVEPRGAVALRALEQGSAVTIAEVSEYLTRHDGPSLGGITLSGVVDRLPLHALVPLLARCRAVLAHRAPLVVVSEPAASSAGAHETAANDLLAGHSLHAETWELLLGRAGFADVTHLTAGPGQDRRFALAAAAPA